MAKEKPMTAKPTAAESIFDRFKRLADVKPIAITCIGWGDVFTLPMTVAEAEIVKELDPNPAVDTLAKSVIYTMCDASGKRVFEIGNEEHLTMVKSQPQDAVIDFLTQAQKALGTGAKGADDAKKG